jgi:outer membrane protein OmpA-like peptidoglycan-associated protein
MSAAPVGETTAGLASASVLATLNGMGTVWANINNQTTPYLLSNAGPVYVAADTSPLLYNLVFTPAQLQAINNNPTGNYALANDLDMSGMSGFVPLGSTIPFAGTFNGLDNVIANLTVSTTGGPTGLFGQIALGATVKNIGLIDSIVGSSGSGDVGGLVGFNNGGAISEAYATGTATGATGSDVGGLVGFNALNATISNAYATGAVIGNGSLNIGGLAGLNAGTISNAYAIASVDGVNGTNIGGLVGATLAGSTITNVYAAGAVNGTGSTSVGGLIGQNQGMLTTGYWNEDRAGMLTGVGTGTATGATGLSGDAVVTATSYAGFAFTTTPGLADNWVIVDTNGSLNNAGGAAGGTMPLLAFEGSGTIHNAHQLQLMAMNAGTDYTLARNIDATATGSSTSAASGTDVWGRGGFIPVGNGIVGQFAGTFDGGGKTITNLTINTSQFYAGLFGQSSGVIRNVGLTGGSVVDSDMTAGDAIGGLVGYNDGKISGAFSGATVSGGRDTGGLVGFNAGGSITDSYAVGAVSAPNNSRVGGLVGLNFGGDISNTYATGVVNGSGAFVGGLVGDNPGTVTTSYWDIGTSGQIGSSGGTGMTTAQLQAALPTGFTSPVWNIIAGVSYPYLAYQFPNGTPQIVSGTLYTGTTAGSPPAGPEVTVSALSNGNAVNSALTGGAVATGGNGYFYYLLNPGTIAPSGSVLLYSNSIVGSGAAFVDQIADGNARDTAIYGNTLHIVTPGGNSSTINASLLAAAGGNSTAITILGTLPNLTIDAAHDLTIDQPLAFQNGAVTLNSGGAIMQTPAGAILAARLTGRSVGGASLDAANAIGTFGSWSDIGNGSQGISLTDNTALTVNGTVSSASGPITLATTTGDLTIAGNLAADGSTISLRSAGGIVETTGLLDPVALLLSSVNSVTMTGANDVNLLAATLTGPNASLTFNSIAPSLTIGTVNGVTGVTTNNGAVTLSASAGSMTLDRSINAGSGMVKAAALGDLTIDAGASVTGGSVILATKGNFTNAAGVGAISVSPSVQPVGPGMIPVGLGGHWLVYSTDPSLDNDGGLTPEFIQYNATYALDTQTGTAPAAPGNGFLYSLTPSLTVIGISKIYDGTTALPTAPGAYSTSGAITGDIVQLNITGASGGYASSDVGNGINVSLTGATVNATRGGIPVFGYQPQTVSNEPIGTISPAGLLITASDQSKTYGETLALGTTGFTAQGLVGGDFVTGVTLASAGSPGAAGVGQYAINASNPTGHGLGNYTIGFADGELTVNPAALLITASNQSKTYGQNLALGISAFTTQGLVNGDTVTGVALNSAGAPASAGVAQYAITASNPTGNGLSNYTIGFADGRLTVNPAALLITASNQAKTYGQNFDLGTTDFTALGLVNGDTVTGVTLNSAGAAAAAGIGQYAIGASNPTGNGLGNYTISVANGKLTVNPAALLITASDQAKTYGQNLALGTTGFTTQGLVDGDMVTGVTLNSAGAPASASVGQYAITATNPAGNGLANYTISVADGKLTVNPATLLIAAANQSKTYGQTLSLGTTDFTTQGLVNGDTVTGIMLKSAGTPATAGVGQYAIGANDPTGSGLANYTISFADGSLTVNPAALLITTLNQSKTYGQNLSLGMTGFTAQGLVNGDTVTAVTLNSAGAPAPAGVGQYAIGASNPTGSNIANYAVTVTQGTLTVNPAALLITATDESKTYGQDQAFGATDFAAQGLVNGDRVTGVTLSSTGASAGAGVGQYAIVASDPTGGGLANYTISVADGKLTVNPAALLITATNRSKTYGQNLPLGSTDFAAQGLVNGDRVNGVTLTSAGASAAAGVAASPYSIVASNPSGSGLANYTIGFADGRLTIEPAPLTVTADNQVRAAGIANPPLTFAVTGGELFNGDALSGALATAATASSAAGAYPITEGSLSASANYRLGFVDGVLTVQPGSIPIPTPPPLPPPSPALPAPATTVAALTTLANLVTPATVEQAAEAAQTGSQKANSPESLALAALSNFRAAACSGSNALPPALFVVLPSATGKAIGGIVVSNGAAETVLDQSFAAAELHGGTLAPCQVSRTAVDTTFHQAIAARPVLPRHFLLYFAPNSDRLTPQSMAQYREALSDVTQRRAYQIEVVGFTDSTGAQADDQKSSLAQAETVRRLLARDRLDPRKISIAGRGKLNPLIPTADQVREPRNRRVEIWVR